MAKNPSPRQQYETSGGNAPRSRLQSTTWLLTLIAGVLLLAWLLARQLSAPGAVPGAPADAGRGDTPTVAGQREARTSTQKTPDAASVPRDRSAGLPEEARETIRKIRTGAPLPHRRDGVVFENRERLLPQHPRGYYHEYTVPTPGSKTRGARRIVVGGDPPEVWYYSDDHYRSFRAIQP